MVINITTIDDISKLLAFLRASAKAAFDVNPELVDTCIREFARFARQNRLAIDLITPTAERVAIFAGGGMLIGAAAGSLIAGVPGGLVGVVVGGLAGFAATHVTIRMSWPAQPGAPAMARLQIV